MRRGLLTFISLMMAACALFPFLWAVITSLKSGGALYSAAILPRAPSLANYSGVFTAQPFGRNLLNSIAIATGAVAISLGAGVFASFALGRRRFAGRRLILVSFLFVSMFPQIAVLSGLFELIRALGLYNTWAGVTLSYMIFTLPFTVWTLTSFMKEVPRALEEAARVDGASTFQTIVSVFLPIMAPSVVTTGLLAFIAAWNEFLFALTFTISERARTVPVAIAMMSGSSEYELPWGNIMAASVVVTLPVVIVVLIFQRRIISGLTSGAVKG